MPSRFTKPDPKIKKNVLRSRASARNAKSAHASIVAASIAATLIAWAMFTNQDARMLEAAQAANSNQAAVNIVAPAQDAGTTQASATQIPGVQLIPRPFR